MQMKSSRSPKVTYLSWGRMEVRTEQGTASYKDAKLFPGGSRKWDWTETGTSHVPGIQPADVAELLEHGAEVVILSRGINERLQICDSTLERLDQQGIETHVLQTEEAVKLYNRLREEKAVGGLFHSTC